MASSDVPDACFMDRPSSTTNSGVMRKPPPMPTYPAMTPASAPMKKPFTSCARGSMRCAGGMISCEPRTFGAFTALRSIFTADHRMTTAAARMMAHDGERLARYTPTGERHAPPNPAATPKPTTHVRCRMCVTQPAAAVGMMVNSDVAVARMACMP